MSQKQKDPKATATRVLRRLKITKAPVPVEQVAKKLGALLQYEPFDGNDDISAMLFRDDSHVVIGVNAGQAKTRQRFSIAHEIGHFLLHEGKMYVDARVNFRNALSSKAIDREEIAANAFAAELLMPEAFVIVEIKKVVDKLETLDADIVIEALARKFIVSIQAMGIRLRNLGLVGE